MSKRARSTLVLLFVSLAWVIGCSESKTPPVTSVPLEDLPSAYASAVCTAADTCLGALMPIFVAGGDCETRYRELLANAAVPLFETAIARGSLGYDPTRVPACMDAIATGGCDALAGGLLPAACEDALTGTVALGGACDLDAECLDDAACVQNTTCPGTCTARGGPGHGCTRNDECQRGFVCDSTVCTAPPAEGQACQGPSAPDCRIGLLCLGGNATRQGTCHTQAELFTAAVGAACGLQAGPWCQEGLACVIQAVPAPGTPATFLCEAPVASGAACQAGVPDPCPPTEYCTARLATGVIDGTCTALPVGGEPCAVRLVGATCAAGHACIAGTCRPLQANGGACGSAAECYSGVCTSGVCVAPVVCTP
jgi:hypothetical protein